MPSKSINLAELPEPMPSVVAHPIQPVHPVPEPAVIAYVVEPIPAVVAMRGEPQSINYTIDGRRLQTCRGCGIQFELSPNTNMCSAAAFRCSRCRGWNSIFLF